MKNRTLTGLIEYGRRHAHHILLEKREPRLAGLYHLVTPDPRTAEVLSWYDRAFADWLARQPEPLDDAARARITAYRTLVSAAKP